MIFAIRRQAVWLEFEETEGMPALSCAANRAPDAIGPRAIVQARSKKRSESVRIDGLPQKQAAPAKEAASLYFTLRCFVAFAQALHPRFTVAIDEDRAAGRRAHLNMVFLSVEAIGDIPIFRVSARYVPAALNVLRIHATATSDIRAHCGSANCATHRGDILPTSTADLVTDDSADDRAGDRTGNVRTTALLHLLMFDPTTLFGWTRRFRDIRSAITAPPLREQAARPAMPPTGEPTKSVIHSHLGERVMTWTQYDDHRSWRARRSIDRHDSVARSLNPSPSKLWMGLSAVKDRPPKPGRS
jgi:hypothetical protein